MQSWRGGSEERVTARVRGAGDVPTKGLIPGEGDTGVGCLLPVQLRLDGG